MSYIEIIGIGIGLAMDAFTVAICKGLAIQKVNWNKIFLVGFYFAIFQAIMPIIGYCVGFSMREIVVAIDHWIVFCLLVVIGANMIHDYYCVSDKELSSGVRFKDMLFPALATSIDALAVGITFAFFDINIIFSVIIIGLITFIITSIGVLIGSSVSTRSNSKAKLFGGIVLILMAIKILIEHLSLF